MIGWKGGSLFPSKEEFENPPADGIFKTKMEEDDMYNALHHMYVHVLKRKDKLGCHTGRKTGYLWGTIRGALSLGLMLAADHDCYEVAARYVKDAEAIMEINRCFNSAKQRLGTWKSPYCAGDETAARSAMPGAVWQKPLPELVVGFIEHAVGISPNDPLRHHPKHVYNAVISWKKPGRNAKGELMVSLYYCFNAAAYRIVSYHMISFIRSCY